VPPGSDGGAPKGDGGAPKGDAGAGPETSNGEGGVDNRIDPITVGRSWTYQVTTLGNYPLCPSGTHTAEAVSVAQRDGKYAYEVTSLCANAGEFFYSVDGDVVQWDYQGTWLLVLDAPVQDGHSWTNGTTSYAWHDAGSVAVQAGTFANCWIAQDTAGPSYTTFCRGVGPVHWHYEDAFGNGYDALLTAKNF
jgi:hypothetical protein